MTEERPRSVQQGMATLAAGVRRTGASVFLGAGAVGVAVVLGFLGAPTLLVAAGVGLAILVPLTIDVTRADLPDMVDDGRPDPRTDGLPVGAPPIAPGIPDPDDILAAAPPPWAIEGDGRAVPAPRPAPTTLSAALSRPTEDGPTPPDGAATAADHEVLRLPLPGIAEAETAPAAPEAPTRDAVSPVPPASAPDPLPTSPDAEPRGNTISTAPEPEAEGTPADPMPERGAAQRVIDAIVHLPLGALVVDRSGLVVEANADARRLLGIEPPTWLAYDLLSFEAARAPYRLVDAHDVVARVVHEGQDVVHRVARTLHDERVLVSAGPVPGDEGVTDYVLVTLECLPEAEHHIEVPATVTGAGQPALAVDHNGKIAAWNTLAESVLGRRAEDAIGHGVDLLTPTRHDHGWVPSLEHVVFGTLPWHGRISITDADFGVRYCVAVVTTPDDQDAGLRALCVLYPG